MRLPPQCCPLCNSDQSVLYHNVVWNGPGRQVMQCCDCKSYFLDPPLTDEEQRKFDRDYDRYIASRAAIVESHTAKAFEAQVDESIDERLRDIGHWFPTGASVLEIGAERGGFLDRIAANSGMVSAVDSCPEYLEILNHKGYTAYRYLSEVPQAKQYDRICLFSLLEHIQNPKSFLSQIRTHLAPTGCVIIEIPSANDPLISLYDLDAFKSFYFQAMHPYVYSELAARRLLVQAGFKIVQVQYKQRYGLANHLQWLKAGAPGGNATYADVFSGAAEDAYIKALEASGHTDTIYIVATIASIDS